MSSRDSRSPSPLPLAALLVLLVWLVPTLVTADEGGIDHLAVLGEPESTPLSGEALDRETERVASLMRCVACQGLSVAASPSPAAIAMKGEVRELLAEGYTEEQILGYFEGGFGEFIRLAPKAEGFNLLVWIAPVAALLLGVLLIAARLGGGRKAKAAPAAEEDDLSSYVDRVRSEVSE